jgi:hypothetical protein
MKLSFRPFPRAAALVVLTGALASGPAMSGATAINLGSFGGIEEPAQVYHAGARKFTADNFKNITDQGAGTFRMFLRYNHSRWDGDRTTGNTDRQRAEVKVLGPRQKPGETFEYASTWRLNPGFKNGSHFCHVMQVKGYGGGEIAAPLVTTSILTNTASAVRYVSGSNGFQIARSFTFSPGDWRSVRVRLKVSTTNSGELRASINGDALQGKTGVPMYRAGAPEYQPKWGLYRGVDTKQPFGDDYVEHRAVSANKL